MSLDTLSSGDAAAMLAWLAARLRPYARRMPRSGEITRAVLVPVRWRSG